MYSTTPTIREGGILPLCSDTLGVFDWAINCSTNFRGLSLINGVKLITSHLNNVLKLHPTNDQLYDYLPPISQNIQENENSEFRPVVLELKIVYVAHPTKDEHIIDVLQNMNAIPKLPSLNNQRLLDMPLKSMNHSI